MKGKIFILDFSNEYEDITENVFYLDEINLLDSKLNYHDIKAINAGYLHDSHCLYRKCVDLIMETEEYQKLKKQFNNDTSNEEFKKEMHLLQVPNLIDNTMERLHISWNKIETEYAKLLNDRIPKKRSKNHISLEQGIEKILPHDVIRFQSKTMQSEHQRAVAFCLLTRLSFLLDEPFTVIADDLNIFFNKGNTKLFLESLRPNAVEFVYSFNKPSVIPKSILPYLSSIYFHKIDNNSELKELTRIFGFKEKDDILKAIRSLRTKKYQVFANTEIPSLAKK